MQRIIFVNIITTNDIIVISIITMCNSKKIEYIDQTKTIKITDIINILKDVRITSVNILSFNETSLFIADPKPKLEILAISIDDINKRSYVPNCSRDILEVKILTIEKETKIVKNFSMPNNAISLNKFIMAFTLAVLEDYIVHQE